jgi:hypothetical protein
MKFTINALYLDRWRNRLAVNSMFRETLHAKEDITIIASGDAKLVSESAEFITEIIVGSKGTAILRRVSDAIQTFLGMSVSMCSKSLI